MEKNIGQKIGSESFIESVQVSSYDSSNLVKDLLVQNPTNDNYITFEIAIQINIFNAQVGKLKNFTTTETKSLNELLKENLIKSENPNILFDSSKVYHIESVLFNDFNRSVKIDLEEAVRKSIIDKNEMLYILPTGATSTIEEAIVNGYIQGKIFTSFDLKLIFLEYSNKTIPKPKKLPVKKQPLTVENVLKSWRTLDVQYSQKDVSSEYLESFGDFFIFDDELESYVTINDAFYNGVILNDPVRIKEPVSGSFILLKDAVIKGLISCEKSDEKVSFKNRSSFFTLNRVSFIIDCVFDWKKKTKYSLQEAIKKGLLLNGVYKNTNKNESYKLDEAIEAGFIIGKRIELEKIDAIFQRCLNSQVYFVI
jgi:hypothetical protein